MHEIERALRAGAQERNWKAAPLGELAKHIVATHHEYFKLELPALGNRLDEVQAVHGASDPETVAAPTGRPGLASLRIPRR